VFNYEGEVFPREILEVNEKKSVIRAMQKSLKAWKYPEKDHIMYYA
jgi:hypothetical protein